jgi:crotonobetainyl-CoA:carnitine CoA-transferase CaiB-like acyl-CoA transferase
LRDIFLTRTSADWITFGDEHNTPLAPVNTPTSLQDDPQFQARLGWIGKDVLQAEQLPSPIKVVGGELPVPSKAPTVGQHAEEILTGVLGYDEARITALRESGALG